MQQASLGLNCSGPGPLLTDSSIDNVEPDKYNSLMRKNVVVKSEILTNEVDQAICGSHNKLKVKQEALEEEVSQHEVLAKVDALMNQEHHQDYRSDNRHYQQRNSVYNNNERKEEYTSGGTGTAAAVATASPTHKHYPDRLDFPRTPSQQFSGNQHPAYRQVGPPGSGLPTNAFGFPHFYGPQPSSSVPQSPSGRSIDSTKRTKETNDRNHESNEILDEAVTAYRHNAAGMLNEAFLRDYRMEMNDFHHVKPGANFSNPPGYPAAAFRPSLARAYAHQQQNNNNVYRNHQQQFSNNSAAARHNKHKWNNNTTVNRTLHPPAPPVSLEND